MNNTEKKLDALIDALGFDVEHSRIECGAEDKYIDALLFGSYYKSDYKLTKREGCVPIEVQSKEWGCIVNFVLSHREDIRNDINDYGGLGVILDFMEGDYECK